MKQSIEFDFKSLSKIEHPLTSIGLPTNLVIALEKGATIEEMIEILLSWFSNTSINEIEDAVNLYKKILLFLPAENMYEYSVYDIMKSHSIEYKDIKYK